jgi:hypothetical protein
VQAVTCASTGCEMVVRDLVSITETLVAPKGLGGNVAFN